MGSQSTFFFFKSFLFERNVTLNRSRLFDYAVLGVYLYLIADSSFKLVHIFVLGRLEGGVLCISICYFDKHSILLYHVATELDIITYITDSLYYHYYLHYSICVIWCIKKKKYHVLPTRPTHTAESSINRYLSYVR